LRWRPGAQNRQKSAGIFPFAGYCISRAPGHKQSVFLKNRKTKTYGRKKPLVSRARYPLLEYNWCFEHLSGTLTPIQRKVNALHEKDGTGHYTRLSLVTQ